MKIETLESVLLVDDRTEALARLDPGNNETFYLRCLQAQASGRLDDARALLGQWLEQRGSEDPSPEMMEIINRMTLLTFGEDPKGASALLQEQLSLSLDHRRDVVLAEQQLPSVLDPALLSLEAFDARARSSKPTLSAYSDWGLERLVSASLVPAAREQLLDRLPLPDVPGLLEVLVEELSRRGLGWGANVSICSRLLRSQLDALCARLPELSNEPWMVAAYLAHLAVLPEQSLDVDPEGFAASVAELWAYVEPLEPAFTELKAAVLHALLRVDWLHGEVQRARLVSYLALPRAVPYVTDARRREVPKLTKRSAELVELTGLSQPGDDSAFVAKLLRHALLTSSELSDLEPLLDRRYLRAQLAEAHLLAGSPGQEQWAQLLGGAEAHARLRARVDIEFDPTNPSYFAAGAPVRLKLWLKNVPQLVIKVFEINALGYYLARGEELSTAIDLDGLVPTEEQRLTLDEAPILRTSRAFSFDALSKPGTYIIDFIGGGRASRALVRKGELKMLPRTTRSGQVLQVFDGEGKPVAGAKVFVAGRAFEANDAGEALVPFAEQDTERKIILAHGSLASLVPLLHQVPSYALRANFHLERESLLSGRTALILARPRLTAGGEPVRLTSIEETSLQVSSVDLQGSTATREFKGLCLDDDALLTQAFRVPDELQELTLKLTVSLRDADGERVELSDEASFSVNEIDTRAETRALFLTRSAEGLVLRLLGKAGEPYEGVALEVSVWRRGLSSSFDVQLQTDAHGRVLLGQIEDAEQIEAHNADTQRRWRLSEHAKTRLPEHLNVPAGERARIAYTGCNAEGAARREYFSLLSRRGSAFMEDHLDALSIEGGCLVIAALAPGEYQLTLKEQAHVVKIQVAERSEVPGWLRVDARGNEMLRASSNAPLAIVETAMAPSQLRIRIDGGRPGARVHVLATRFVPSWPLQLDAEGALAPSHRALRSQPSHYVEGRIIGDEYRYVLDRRYAPKRRGNMLPRPGLLLSPWTVGETETARDEAKEGGSFGHRDAVYGRSARSSAGGGIELPDCEESLEFLAHPAVVLANLEPDEHGVVIVPAEALRLASQLTIVASDALSLVAKELLLPEPELSRLPAGFQAALDPSQTFAETVQIEALRAGESLQIEASSNAELAIYDTIERVFALYRVFGSVPQLDGFSFITRWDTCSDDEKRALFSEHACHELSFFIARKDPAFFAAVVGPFLANKRDKTFLDHYLLGADLSPYLELTAFEKLNLAEQILLEQQVAGLAGPWTRRVRELCELQTQDPESEAVLIRLALRSRAFDEGGEGGGGGRGGADDYVKPAFSRLAMKEEMPMMAPPPPPMPAMPPSAPMAKKASAPPPPAPARAARASADTSVAATLPEEPSLGGGKPRPLYKRTKSTEELAESNYYRRRARYGSERIAPSAFWRDVAMFDGRGPFLSSNIARPTGSFTEMMLALSLLDLPFRAQPHQQSSEQGKLTLSAGSACVVFAKGIRQVSPISPSAQHEVLLAQSFMRMDERTESDARGQEVDKPVRGPFVSGVMYVCKVVVTNLTSAPQRLSLLLQLPKGALPVERGSHTITMPLRPGPYETCATEYGFYFPEPGRATQLPAQVSRDGAVLAAAEPKVFEVVALGREEDRSSWLWLSQYGSDDEVIEALRASNLFKLDLSKIGFRMRERRFYDRALALLDERRVAAPELRAYAVFHADESRIGQVLRQQQPDFLQSCGWQLDSPVLRIDAVRDGHYEHLEYEPLINARAHQLGAERKILNDKLASQYQRFLKKLTYGARLSDDDRLALAYYLLLQDRVDEAKAQLERVSPESVETRLQLDYLRAYVLFFGDQPEAARQLALPYASHPVARWRERFSAVLTQLDEAQSVFSADTEGVGNDALASGEPAIDLMIEGRTVSLHYQNVRACEVRYFQTDVELLFSRRPFSASGRVEPSFVAPNAIEHRELPEGGHDTFEIDERLTSSLLVVEVEASGVRASAVCTAHALRVQLIENYGQLQVADAREGRALPGVYVKVYARSARGKVSFHKDGYTDLRGRFDYVSLSTRGEPIERFAMLVLSPEHGALVREAAPPLH